MLMVAGSEDAAVRSTVMETAGLWYLRRTSSCCQNFLGAARDQHCGGRWASRRLL